MIVIVGAGALGSHVALFLRNTDHVIKLVDFDKVEMKNTHAQFHTRMGMGKNKAHALAQMMTGMFGRKLEVTPHMLTKENAPVVLGGVTTDLVLDCTDNIKTRYAILDHCTDHDIPCLHGCLSADGTFARFVWSEYFVPDAEGREEATCEDGEHLPFFATAAGFMSGLALQFLEDGRRRNFQLTPNSILNI